MFRFFNGIIDLMTFDLFYISDLSYSPTTTFEKRITFSFIV